MPPRRSRSKTAEEYALERFNQNFEKAALQAAQSWGQPAGSRPVGDAEKVRQWGLQDSNVDRTALTASLLTQGLAPELLDPNNPQAPAVMKAAPDLAPLYGQPVQDSELADTLAGLAQYPFRYGLLAGIDDPEEQVKEAERLSRLHEQQTQAALTAVMAGREQPREKGAEAPGGVQLHDPVNALPAGMQQGQGEP
jgi:hypothetical protein